MSLRDWWDAKVRPWLKAVQDISSDEPLEPSPPKTHHGPIRDPPHSLSDEIERKWPAKKDRDQ